jgi:subtilisin family serine protease
VDHSVLSFAPFPPKIIQNRYSSGFVQSGSQVNVYDSRTGHFATFRSLDAVGLNGSGQVINVVDTGVDMSNVFFADREYGLEEITDRTELRARKVVRIDAIADNVDSAIGHGTHVCGVAAGYATCAPRCAAAQYNGIAIGARLYVSDIGLASVHGDLSGNVDLVEQARVMREMGAHVSSNSWSAAKGIPEVRFLYDKAAFENQDILYVFAAGNGGGYDRITSPSDSKNVLTVGGSDMPSGAMAEWADYQKMVLVNGENGSVMGVDSNARIWRGGLANPVRYFTDKLAVTAEENVSGRVVILERAECNVVTQLEKMGAVAIVTKEDAVGDCESELPVITAAGVPGIISLLPFPGNDGTPVEITGTSSRGPAETGIWKPDIAFPGDFVRSACAHGEPKRPIDREDVNEAVIAMSGSSMSAPGAAGAAAIICQFLEGKWYPNFAPGSGLTVRVTSALIRALLAASSEKTHNLDGGYGIPNLSALLEYQGYGVRIAPDRRMESGGHHMFRLTVDNRKCDLVVSMAYVDAPLAPRNVNPLYADLDLIVVDPTGRVFFGNERQDEFSTIEKVIVDKGELVEGVYVIHIFNSESAAIETVNYSIVVRGPFDHFDFVKNPVQLAHEVADSCLPGCAACVAGKCVCRPGEAGRNCQRTVTGIREGEAIPSTVVHGDVNYFALVNGRARAPGEAMGLTVNRIDGNATPRLYVCTSGKSGSSIANPHWECLKGAFGHDVIEVENFSEFYLALFIGSAESVTLNVTVLRLASSGDPVNIGKDGSEWVRIAATAAAMVSASVLLLVTCWRLQSTHIRAAEEEELGLSAV